MRAGSRRRSPRRRAGGCVAPVHLQTVCVRHEPADGSLDGEALDAHTTAWVEAVNRSGAAYLTPAILDGRWMARVSIGALATEAADVAAVWAAMREAAEGAAGESGASLSGA